MVGLEVSPLIWDPPEYEYDWFEQILFSVEDSNQ